MADILANPARVSPLARDLRICVNGVDVEGRVNGCAYDIDVEITKPFANLVASSHIMLIARGVYSFNGEYGEQRAEEMLTDLYWVGDYVFREFKVLASEFSEYRHQVAEISAGESTSNQIGQRRQILRERSRQGDITKSEYQKWVGQMRKNVDDLELRKWQLKENFFEANFPMELGSQIRKSVIDVLNENKLISRSE